MMGGLKKDEIVGETQGDQNLKKEGKTVKSQGTEEAMGKLVSVTGLVKKLKERNGKLPTFRG